jgi:hypothetical protein
MIDSLYDIMKALKSEAQIDDRIYVITNLALLSREVRDLVSPSKRGCISGY